MLHDIADGLRWLVGHPLQRTLTAMVAVGAFGASAVFAVFVLYAVAPGPMGLSEVGFGFLLTASGAGSLVGSVVVAPIERRLGIATTLIASHAVFGVTFLVLAATTEVVVVAAALAGLGVATKVWNLSNVSHRQRFMPAGMYGRVHAGHRLANRGAALLGGVSGGLLGGALGLQAVFAVAGVVVLVSCVGAVVVNDERVAAALAAAGQDAAGPEGEQVVGPKAERPG